MKLKHYLGIGFIVQCMIIGARLGMGKTQKYWKEYECDRYKKSPIFWIGVILAAMVGSIINIVLWPLSIVSEIYNTKKGW